MNVAILGATSHIAKSLIYNFAQTGDVNLYLYTRSKDNVNLFLRSFVAAPRKTGIHIHQGYRNFGRNHYDVIINCVGVGTENKLKGDYSRYFMVTEEYDNLIIKYLCDIHPEALYITFSSGAVYGRTFTAPVNESTKNCISVNHVAPANYYSITRLNAEAKHRSFNKLKIVDLRVFSFFSRFIDLADGYFITELINCVLEKRIFITNKMNIIRDYIHPLDLYSIIRKCMNAGNINTAFDVRSAKPVEKNEILAYFSARHCLLYQIAESIDHVSATGGKNIYYSTCDNISLIGYKPLYRSIDSIMQESEQILFGLNPDQDSGRLVS